MHILQNPAKLKFCQIFISKFQINNLVDLLKNAENAHLLAKISADTAENEQHCAEILPIGRGVAGRARPAGPSARTAGSARWVTPARRLVPELHRQGAGCRVPPRTSAFG